MFLKRGFGFHRAQTLSRTIFILTIALSFFNIWDIRQASAACVIQGLVYIDYNNNGTQQAGTEPGQGGITVNAYFDRNGDGTSELILSTTTSATNNPATDGSYQLNIIDDGQIRVEFVGVPDYLYSGRFGAGNNSTTTVTFVDCNGGGNIDVNLALAEPGAYCHTNTPDLGTSCYVQDDQASPLVANIPTFVSFPYNSNGAPVGDLTGTGQEWTLANAPDIGTTWGLAYQRSSDSFYAAAFMKRFAGFGPGGTGGIYRLSNASTHALGNTSLFMDLTPLGTGTDPHPVGNPACGAAPNAGCWQVDTNSYNRVGKSSLGGMDVSENDKNLFVLNLDRTGHPQYSDLLEIPIGANGVAPALGAIIHHPLRLNDLPGTNNGATACPGGINDFWPFAVSVHAGRVYVGSVCTAESTQQVDDLRAYVHSFDPLNPGLGFQLDLTFKLDYPRRCTLNAPNCTLNRAAFWKPWTPNWPTPSAQNVIIYPEPWLTDIVFDNDHMVIGLRDRFGDRSGNSRPGPNDDPNNLALLTIGMAAGDVLRACWDDTTTSWTLEANGTCGGVTSTNPVPANNAGQGPGDPLLPINAGNPGNEYYYQDNNNPVAPPGQHDEITIGGLADLPGGNLFAITVYDPLPPGFFAGDNGLYDAGVVWFDNTTGARARQYRLINGDIGVNHPANQFGKSNGLGDLEAVCGPEPLEIGNRVWEDLDRNGVQDPGELPIANVVVNLYMDQNNNNQFEPGELVGQTTTDGNGEYYFNEFNVFYDGVNYFGLLNQQIADVNYVDINGNGTREVFEPIGLLPNRSYEVALDDPTNYGVGAPLDNYYLTPRNQDPLADGNGDSRDSDGVNPNFNALVSAVNFPIRTLTTGDYGDNNHTYDFGFSRIVTTPTPTPTITVTAPGGVTSNIGFTLTKTVDTPFGAPGTIVTWTLTISNPYGVPATNVEVKDTVPTPLIILSVTDDSATGTTTTIGQTVTFNQAVLNPNETVKVVIKTQVPNNTTTPFIITNEASGTCCNGLFTSPPAKAQVVSAKSLPATGDSWMGQFRIPLLLISISLGLMALVRLLGRRNRGMTKG